MPRTRMVGGRELQFVSGICTLTEQWASTYPQR